MDDKIHSRSGDDMFQLSLGHAILAAQRSARQVGLLIIDFERVDDLLEISRSFLEQAWTRVRNTLRDSDPVVQLDDGPIGALLPSINSCDDAILIAKKILAKLEDPFPSENIRFDVQPRIGLAVFPEHSNNAAVLIQQAHIALHTAKRIRKNYVLFSHDHNHLQRAPLRMSQLRQGIVGDEMFLLFQPKIDLRDGTVSSVEALARWRHPELGLILPEEFIPVAERTGLIVPLTLWVLHRSLMQCLAWNQSGIDLRVAVNLSMWNLDAQELPDQIAGLLESVNISPHRLELEITESSVMNDPRRSLINLTRIKELGVRLSIDDFGAGYSSLAYLTKLPVKGLKIDKSFVQNMATERDNAVIVKSIVDLGHNLGLKVVAEGVETRETVEILRAFKCDEAQGYYFSRPIPGDKVPPWLRKTARLLAGQKPTKGGPTHANMEQPTQTQSAESSRAPVNYPREAALTFLDSEYDFSLKQR